MKMMSLAVLAALSVTLAACQKKSAEAPVAETTEPAGTTAQAPTADQTAPPAELTQADRERMQKQAQLDYATMEDGFLNDAKAQWAKEVKASSTFGETQSSGPSDGSKAANMAGKPDGRTWTNDNQDMGFDWIEATFEKPVHATEVRVVIGDGSESVSKLELMDEAGAYTTVWSGINEDRVEERGSRTWFVRKFEKTLKPIVGVKVTIANAVSRGYKVVDAVQLVGE